MTVSIYRYNIYPHNPNHLPYPTQGKYNIRNFSSDMSSEMIRRMEEFEMNMNIIFGDTVEFDSDRDKEKTVTTRYSDILDTVMKEYLETNSGTLIKTIDMEPNYLYNTFFARMHMMHRDMEMETTYQMAVSQISFAKPMVSKYHFRFKITS